MGMVFLVQEGSIWNMVSMGPVPWTEKMWMTEAGTYSKDILHVCALKTGLSELKSLFTYQYYKVRHHLS